MDKKQIIEALKTIGEAKTPGVDVTNKVLKDSKKVNKDHYKDVAKKIGDYQKSPTKQEIDAPKRELTDEEQELTDLVHGGKGMENIVYDNDPDANFKERAEKAITGDSTMGNKIYTGDENGNTEPVWGASDAKFGEKLLDRSKRLKKKADDAKLDIVQFGDDIEVANNDNKVKNKKIAYETVTKKPIMKSKKFIYKKNFNGVENAVKLIPESYKVDGYKFQMTDGVETFDIKWEGALNEGEAVVLRAANTSLISEDINKMSHLYNFDTKKSIKPLTNKEKINENEIFKSLLNESKKKVLTEEIELTPKEKSILSNILGENDGSFSLGEADGTEGGGDFKSVYQKAIGYAKKGLMTTALLAALMGATASYGQEQQQKLKAGIEQVIGQDGSEEEMLNAKTADGEDLFTKTPDMSAEQIGDLDFGKYAKFGDKYFETIDKNYGGDNSAVFKIKINHPLYQNKKDAMQEIIKYNYALKQKYGKVTFEFYGDQGGQLVKRGAFAIK